MSFDDPPEPRPAWVLCQIRNIGTFRHVSQANMVAYDGNTIRIAAGQYVEAPIRFDKQLRIESRGGSATIQSP